MSTVPRVAVSLVGGLMLAGLAAGPAFAAAADPAPSPTDYPVPSVSATYTTPSPVPKVVASDGSVAPDVLAQNLSRVPAKKVTKPKVVKVVQPSGALAYTGSDAIVGGLAVGSILVLVGGVLVVGTRRRGSAA